MYSRIPVWRERACRGSNGSPVQNQQPSLRFLLGTGVYQLQAHSLLSPDPSKSRTSREQGHPCSSSAMCTCTACVAYEAVLLLSCECAGHDAQERGLCFTWPALCQGRLRRCIGGHVLRDLCVCCRRSSEERPCTWRRSFGNATAQRS